MYVASGGYCLEEVGVKELIFSLKHVIHKTVGFKI